MTQSTSFIKCRYPHLAHASAVGALHAPVPITALVLGNLSDVGVKLDRLLCQATHGFIGEVTKSLSVAVNATADKQRYHL
jgi:hypothetical protein